VVPPPPLAVPAVAVPPVPPVIGLGGSAPSLQAANNDSATVARITEEETFSRREGITYS
jgi:hypothetical protein